MFTEEPINTNIEEILKQNFDWVKVNIIDRSNEISEYADKLKICLSLLNNRRTEAEEKLVREILDEINATLNNNVRELIKFSKEINIDSI